MSKAISRASFRRSNDTRRRRQGPTGFSGLRNWLADWKTASHGETESLQNNYSRPRQGCLLEKLDPPDPARKEPPARLNSGRNRSPPFVVPLVVPARKRRGFSPR